MPLTRDVESKESEWPTRAERLRSLLHRTALVLLPSFSTTTLAKPHVSQPTDFLDGMRGYACLIVFFFHCIGNFYHYENGYWSNGGKDADGYIAQLPIIRVLYSGKEMVLLFFVLSGFSITLRPLRLAQRGAHDELYKNLASATFRRAARLYFPCFVLLGMVFVQTMFGCYRYADGLSDTWQTLKGMISTLHLEEGQFLHFVLAVWIWADPMNPATRIRWLPYATQLWTIPVELRGSFISWIVVIGVSRVRPLIRLGLLFLISSYVLARNHQYEALFLFGVVLAELYVQREALPVTTTETAAYKVRSSILFAVSLFFLSYPAAGGATSLGWQYLYKMAMFATQTPPIKELSIVFYPKIGAILCVYIVSQSQLLQRMFSTAVAKYCGKISFSLYYVHYAILNWFGFRVMIAFWDSPLGNNLGFALSFLLVVVPIVLCAADRFCRAVDEPSVRLARLIETWCLDKCI